MGASGSERLDTGPDGDGETELEREVERKSRMLSGYWILPEAPGQQAQVCSRKRKALSTLKVLLCPASLMFQLLCALVF